MFAGKLRHVVSIQGPDPSRDDHGDETYKWPTVAVVRAKVKPTAGKEGIEAGAIIADTTHVVTMRWRPGVTTLHRLVHKGRVLDIVSVINVDERNIELEVGCMESGTESGEEL